MAKIPSIKLNKQKFSTAISFPEGLEDFPYQPIPEVTRIWLQNGCLEMWEKKVHKN